MDAIQIIKKHLKDRQNEIFYYGVDMNEELLEHLEIEIKLLEKLLEDIKNG